MDASLNVLVEENAAQLSEAVYRVADIISVGSALFVTEHSACLKSFAGFNGGLCAGINKLNPVTHKFLNFFSEKRIVSTAEYQRVDTALFYGR